MEKILFITEIFDLIGLVEESDFNDNKCNGSITSETLANYWVNDLLLISGKLPVKKIERDLDDLDEVESFCSLRVSEMEMFKLLLFDAVESFDITDLGTPTMNHRVKDGRLEFYILRG